MRAVSRVLDVSVQSFVLLDFNAYIGLIDAMGGLDMHIREPITVDPLGPGNTITLEPGVQTLSGEVALAYARNRSTAFDDFDRAARQQEVLMAIRDQVVDFNMLPGLVLKAPELYQELSSGIRTNLTLDQLVRLAWLASQVPEENIRRSAFDFRKDFLYETIETDAGPQAVLILKAEGVRRVKEELFLDQ
jgi:anionic cell wall polymer biosynthesis LytR-Cps2A-Psr (LCP) family protein